MSQAIFLSKGKIKRLKRVYEVGSVARLTIYAGKLSNLTHLPRAPKHVAEDEKLLNIIQEYLRALFSSQQGIRRPL